MPDGRSTIEYASPDVSGKRVTNVWATLGCILAVGFLIPPIALAGAIASWIGLRNSANPHIGGRRAALIGLRLGIVGLALIPAEAVGAWWAVGKIDEARCRSQLSAIVFEVQMYANGHSDQLPPNLSTIAAEWGRPPTASVYFCPVSSVATARPYVYLRAAQHTANVKNPASTVMLYELPNHFGGMNVAFYDGHLEFVARNKAAKVLAELSAGQNPPPSLAAP
jgi:prepilin-type processing-associated H-X9-DG protein